MNFLWPSESLRYRLVVSSNGNFTMLFLAVNWLKSLSYRFVTAQKISEYLNYNKKVCLNLGCGKTRLFGWINADIRKGEVYINAKKRLPFRDASVSFINSEEMLEYFTWNDAVKFFKEAFRVLKKDGVMRISTPDLDYIVDLYRGVCEVITIPQYTTRTRYLYRNCSAEVIPDSIFLFETLRGHGHSGIYNQKALETLRQIAGFSHAARCDYRKSKYQELQNIEQHHDHTWLQNATLVMEFIK